MRSAPETFTRKTDAERYLSLVEAQMMRGEWADPVRGKVRLEDYARTCSPLARRLNGCSGSC